MQVLVLYLLRDLSFFIYVQTLTSMMFHCRVHPQSGQMKSTICILILWKHHLLMNCTIPCVCVTGINKRMLEGHVHCKRSHSRLRILLTRSESNLLYLFWLCVSMLVMAHFGHLVHYFLGLFAVHGCSRWLLAEDQPSKE